MKKYITIFLILALTSGCAVHTSMLNRAFDDELYASESLIKSGQYRQAVDELSMLLEMDSGNEKALFLRGIAYQNLENFPLAIKDYEETLKKNPEFVKAHYNLGMIFAFKLNDVKNGLYHFDQFLTLNPYHKNSFNVAKLMCSIDDGKDNDLTEQPMLQEIMSQAVNTPDLDGRRKILAKGIKMNPSSPILYYLMGQTYEAEGNNKEAVKYYKLSIEKRPTCARCNRSLGNILIQGEDEDLGQLYLRKATLFDPNSTS